MSVRDIVQQLRDMGYEVSFFVRKDGGIRITRIGEQRFTGSSGNIAGRTIVGVQLSERRAKQLSTIRTPKGSWGHNKLQKLPKDLERELRKAQRLFRKQGVKSGSPRTKQLRYLIKTYGEEEARRKLKQASRYALGLAYDENIGHLISRFEMDKVGATAEEIAYIEKIIAHINKYRDQFKEEWLGRILERIYDFERNILSAGDLYSFVVSIVR